VIAETVAHRIAVFSGKGGVGKTTVAVNLACLLAQESRHVGLLDADITGPNVLQMMGIDETPTMRDGKLVPHQGHGIEVVSLASLMPPDAAVIWRGPMRSKALEQLLDDTDWAALDTLVMDLPPGTGDEALTIAKHVSPQLAIIVTTPQEVALLDARRAISFARKLKIPHIAIVENMGAMVCPTCGHSFDLFGDGGGKREAEAQQIAFLGAIPIDPAARRSGDEGTPIALAAPESAVGAALQTVAARTTELLSA